MGGALPLGYQVEDRKLYIDKQEAETVEHIFRRFIALRSITTLLKELNRDGYLTKQYVRQTA